MTACLICGDSESVRTSLVAWREPVGGRTFEAIPRCVDHDACQARVHEQGDTWPLWESGKRRPTYTEAKP